MILRDRQQLSVDLSHAALLEHSRTVAVAPTGAGKTCIFSALIKRFLEESPTQLKVLVLAHRGELVTQNREKFLRFCPNVTTSVVDADNKDWSGQVVFAMQQTLSRDNNLDNMPALDLFVIDEAHHAPAESYQKIITRAEELNQDFLLYGVTATPNRGDKKGLGKTFYNCADQIEIGELIASGHLVRPRTYVVDVFDTQVQLKKLKPNNMGEFNEGEVAAILDQEPVNTAVVEKWFELAQGRQTVVFCSTIEHAKHVTNAFSNAGIMAALITGETSKENRAYVLEQLANGIIQVIVNVAVLTEGWDYPPISCVILLRMSSFKSTMLQMIGRGLRIIDNREYENEIKTDCVVLDFGASCSLHGKLEEKIDLWREPGKIGPQKECPDCEHLIPLSAMECAFCGYVIGAKEKEEKERIELFAMLEIDMLEKSKFAWDTLILKDSETLIASGFDAWACIVKDGEHYAAVRGASNKDAPLHTEIIYKGDKATAIAKGNDALYEIESEEIVRKNAKWRLLPASDKQVGIIKNYKAKYELRDLNKGRASSILAFEFNAKRELRKLGFTL